jgi:carboxymethylenebutenolidase
MVYDGMLAETVRIHGHEGDLIDAYFARPIEAAPYPGVVVIHHMPGYDEATKEIAHKFACHGYSAIVPDLHFREGKGSPEANSASIKEAGGMPDDRSLGDIEAAAAYLRTLPYHNGKVGVIGYCSGGRQVYLTACKLTGIDAAVDCYGGGVTAPANELTERQPVAPIDFTESLSCPLLGLFGVEDKRPSPADVAKTEEVLRRFGKEYEFHSYENAGHSFFSVDRPSYRQEAAVDGWKKIFDFYGRYLN